MLAILFIFFVGILSAANATQDAQPEAPRRRVLIVSIDGLRPDVMLRANAPTLRALMESGSFTCWARTTAVALTLPSHVSMLTGVRPQKHQIEWNRDLATTQPVYPASPTIFELARKAGYSTALVAAKSKFAALDKPGTLDDVWIPPRDSVPDEHAASRAIQIIESKAPQVMFVHFGASDAAGHAKGWGSREQLAAIQRIDAILQKVLDALKARGVLDETLVIVSSDHGGAGKNHGADDDRSRYIPWIASGPGVRRGYDLTRDAELHIRTEDTFATACYWLKIKPPGRIDGTAVRAIFEPADTEESAEKPASQPSAEQTSDAAP